jgi:AraC-like DNA-binding protein
MSSATPTLFTPEVPAATTTAGARPLRPTRGRRSPLAPHGTAARAVGRPGQGIPGCKCQPCRDAKNKADTLRHIANASGRPVRVPAAPVAAHIRTLLDAGMGWTRIARAAHCSSCTISRILNGQELVRRTVAERLLAVRYRPAPGRYVDATGTRRRVQALMAIGHTVVTIAAESGVDGSVIHDVLNGCPTVRGITADRIAAAYDWLSERQPTGRQASITVSVKRAAREGWAPPAAWDDDRIDDPDAYPDWTGYCGTDRGWWVHRRLEVPGCGRCDAAHQVWVEERTGLTLQERNVELLQARAAAVSREADLAADARELMRHGVDADLAADRLGVSRKYLERALHRQAEAVSA